MSRAKIHILLDREEDGRWIGEAEGFPGVLAYGKTREEAIKRTVALCLRVIVEQLEHDEPCPALPLKELFSPAPAV